MGLWDSAAEAPVFVADVPPWHPLALLAGGPGLSLLAASAAGALSGLSAWWLLRTWRLARVWAAAISIAIAAIVALLPARDALLILGLVSSVAALERFARAPSRAPWAMAAGVVAFAILGTAGSRLPWLLLLAAWIPLARLRPGGVGNSALAGAALAMLAASLLTAFWWLPARALAREAEGGRPIERAGSVPRFFTVRGHEVVREAEAAAGALRGRDLRAFATVDHVPGKVARMAGGDVDTSHPARPIQSARAEGDRVALTIGEGGWTLLASTEPWWPGWRAYWNGERMPPVVVNVRFVGVFVPPGAGRLELRYRPDAFDDGLRAGAAGFLLLVATLAWPWYLAIPQGLYRPRSRVAAGPLIARIVSAAQSAAARHARFAAWALLAAYAAFLFANGVAIAGGSDSSGYLNHARLLRAGSRVVPLELARELRVPAEDLEVFLPLGFAPGPAAETIVPSYPPGLPFHLVLFGIFGARGMALVAPLAAIAAVWLTYLVAREAGLERRWAFWPAALLALFPTFIMHAVWVMSDVVATAWTLAAVLGALRARRSAWWGAFAGAALGISVLVRPTQVLLVPAVALAIGLRWCALLACAAAAAPSAAVQMATGAQLWGGVLRTGYGALGLLLSAEGFAARFLHYARWLAALLSPLVFPLGLSGLAARSAAPRERTVLAAWFVPFFLFYCFYGAYEEWWYTRFLLPALPALLILTLFAARETTARMPAGRGRLLIASLLVVVFAVEVRQIVNRRVWEVARGDSIYPRAIEALTPRLGRRPIVLGMQMSGALYYYREMTMVRADMMWPDRFERLRAHAALAGRRWYALLMDYEAAEAFRRAPGTWVPVARFGEAALYELRP